MLFEQHDVVDMLLCHPNMISDANLVQNLRKECAEDLHLLNLLQEGNLDEADRLCENFPVDFREYVDLVDVCIYVEKEQQRRVDDMLRHHPRIRLRATEDREEEKEKGFFFQRK